MTTMYEVYTTYKNELLKKREQLDMDWFDELKKNFTPENFRLLLNSEYSQLMHKVKFHDDKDHFIISSPSNKIMTGIQDHLISLGFKIIPSKYENQILFSF